MEPRIDYAKVAPGIIDAMLGLATLVCLRALQINGCASCIDMHWKELRAAGESEQRLFSDKELADLTFAVAAINAWNRLNIAGRTVPGTFRVPAARQLKRGA